MAQDAVSRRQVAAGIAAALSWPRRARAVQVVTGVSASRLTPPDGTPYEPPVTLAAVRDLYRRMTTPVRVNGHGPFPFVVDTGSNQTVISSQLGLQLRLVLGAPVEVNGVAGAQLADTTNARLDVGARRHSDAPLLVLSESDIGGPGLLGLNDLDGQAVTLDFHRQALRVEPGRRLARDPGAITMTARRRSGQLTLVDAFLDGIRLTAFLDSGSENTIGNLALRARAVASHPGRPWFTAPIVSVTGQTIEAQIADLPRLRVGGLTLPSWPVAFADLHTFQMWNLVDKPAILLGVDVLSRFDYVCLDFAHDEVRFRVPRLPG